MKKILKILLILIILVLSFIITYGIISGKISDYISVYKEKNKNKKSEEFITYKLETPKLPLEDIYKIDYVTSKKITIEGKTFNYSYDLYIDGNNKLIIKDNINKKQITAETIDNVKSIYLYNTTQIVLLTNDGNIYFNDMEDIKGLDDFENYNIDGFDNFEEVRAYQHEKIYYKDFFTKSDKDGIKTLYAITDKNTYYNLDSLHSYTVYPEKEYKTIEELVKAEGYELIWSGFGYNIYNDGKISYCRTFDNYGMPKDEKEKEVFLKDEEGNDLKIYKLFFDDGNTKALYVISLDNKLYKAAFSHNLAYNTEIIAKPVNDLIVKSLSYQKNKKGNLILNFSDNSKLIIEKHLEGYNLYRK